ncbi:malto-oligosyltrehalose synthase [Frigoribacterium faeni]|uniref:(1->4)-alpha-D-glucan 1-alpha-D-glucosylmutase n=1 Tax=Frigoribacterium faeni TaxID=145483 RepID=A0A7W3JIH5_9MICO|nr:malto-oligosyltrehalose synthase [Frigoribacterium faeni]MBA8813391.1 (1->4)-alpha-D-glucan 1-alpha-D-glucosylmutase [Frigoribacterium faeni]GEK83092.1 putative maltooligosyl trehalose synthase [Frigoribacterium faeni]
MTRNDSTRHPRSTYRLQIRASFDLFAAADVVPYLRDLGADWVYLSPVLEAEPGSDHGYDVVDHSRVDPARGGEVGLHTLSDRAHVHGLGVLVDIVPNHVGVATPKASVWWWDLLTHGRDSRYADAFDVDWAAGGGKVLLPVLGEPAAADGSIDGLSVVGEELHYYDNVYPIAPGTRGDDDDAAAVHARQSYELVHWKRADGDLNYRRFFAVNTLAGIRVEEGWVFDESHAEIGRWFRDGLVDGLRVDHPDGLADPKGYLDRLSELTGRAHVLVEKILEGDERLPEDWATAGTTGYDTLADLDRLFVDPNGAVALDGLDARLRRDRTSADDAGDDAASHDEASAGADQTTGDEAVDWHEMILGTKRGIADGILGSEINRLARLIAEGGPAEAAVVDALAELAAAFPVYRSYLPQGADQLTEAVEVATRHRPDLADALERVAVVLRDETHPASVRFQQTSGMVMAKGVEDTAFYRYSRLATLTEVGADPSEFALSPAGFHARQQARLAERPFGMTTLSTHDTKRSADVRARVSVLAEVASEWAATLERLRDLAPMGDGPFENILWQTVVGSWPASRERLHAYAEKASREASTSTTWTDRAEEADAFEERMHAAVDAVFDREEVRHEVERIVDVLRAPGYSNSLGVTLMQLIGPGSPDVYQGGELWDFSLVDPDNRREVDFDLRRLYLEAIRSGATPPVDDTGAAKLLVTHRALTLRRDRPDLFNRYAGLPVFGEQASSAVAVDRGGAIAIATRLPVSLEQAGGWDDTVVLTAGGAYRDVLTGRRHQGGRLRLAEVLETYPVALLIPTED